MSFVTDEGEVYVQVLGPGLERLEELMQDLAKLYSKVSRKIALSREVIYFLIEILKLCVHLLPIYFA